MTENQTYCHDHEPKDYTELECMKKYKLPIDNLNIAFEIASIDVDSPWFLRDIRRKIVEKLDMFCNILTVIIEPDTCLVDMHESREFSDEEKNNLINLFKAIMIIKKDAQLLDIKSTDEKEADFIKKVMAAYPNVQTRMISLVLRTREAWTKETENKKDLGYLG